MEQQGTASERASLTLDYDTRILNFASEESAVQRVRQIAFSDIIGVGSPSNRSSLVVEEASPRPRCISASCKDEIDADSRPSHSFMLNAKGQEPIEISCESEAEAGSWVTALRAAIVDGGGATKLPGGWALATSTVASTEASSLSSSKQSSRHVSPAPEANDQVVTGTCGYGGYCAAPAPITGESVVDVNTSFISPRDLGVVDMKTSFSSPRNAPRDASSAWDVDVVTNRYKDKGHGLSIQERLLQLEFSDDEDEDDADLVRGDDIQAVAAAPAICEESVVAMVEADEMIEDDEDLLADVS
jgi:hypothetical protein